MKIIIKATNFELTPAIESYVNKRFGVLEKFLKRFESEDVPGGRSVVEIFVEVGKTTHHHQKGEVFRAEADLRIGRKQLRVEEIDEALFSAIDRASDILKDQIIAYKEKLEG